MRRAWRHERRGGALAGGIRFRGWAQDESGPAELIDVLVDGDRRPPIGLVRTPRPDVAAALPRLGDVSSAGWEMRLPRLATDSGPAVLTVRFRTPGGRVRTVTRPVVFR